MRLKSKFIVKGDFDSTPTCIQDGNAVSKKEASTI
jgi:hypothetical protein